MLTQFITQHLALRSEDPRFRTIYLNCVCSAILALNSVFFLFYNLVVDYYPPLILPTGGSLLMVIASQYLLFAKKRPSESAMLVVITIALLTHFYMFDLANLEYSLVFGLITPMAAITLLARKLAIAVAGIQFAVFNYLMLVRMDNWPALGFEPGSYVNLVSMWLSSTALFWYIDASRIQAVSKAYEANERLEILAATDGLTGVHNRRFIEKRLVRHPEIHSVALIDVDNFKLVNDRYGHLLGDAVLKGVAHTLEQVFVAVGVVGRWGGEEFMVLFTRRDEAELLTLLEKARAAIDRYPFAIEQSVTISIGWAALAHDGVDQMIRRADQALYSAKSHGKNQVVSASSIAIQPMAS